MPTFNEMGLSDSLLRAVSHMGFEETTPIQESAIPLAMAGKDIIGQAQTGTGKTAAFGIPMIEGLDEGQRKTMALIITPTRELCVQVAEEINTIGKFKGIRAFPVYGGQDIGRQIRSLKNYPQIVAGTPGRLMDHMRRGTLRLQDIQYVILDEADEMLNMGFIEDIRTILKEVPKERQTMLFSATMPRSIQELARQFMNSPELVKVKSKEVTVPNTEQYYLEMPERQKFDILCRLLDIQSPDLAIIFGRTKRRVDELYEGLCKRGYSAEALHGDLSQQKRENVLRHFKGGITDILVATDVAARGLDIDDVTHIYNFDVPQDPESYVHRIGRTGRLGKPGEALTFVTPREIGHLRLIEQTTKRKILFKPTPSFSEAIVGQQRLAIDKILQTIEEGDIKDYKPLAEEILDEKDPVTVIMAALKLLTKEPDKTPVSLTEEAPLRQKKTRSFGGGRSTPGGYRNSRDGYRSKYDGKNKKSFYPKKKKNY